MGYRVGVDIGGTFTDYAIVDKASAALRSLKVPPTPDRPGQEVLDGFRAIGYRYGRRIMAAINPMTGGTGGRAERDGTDGSGCTQGFLKNTPIEINETETPLRFHRHGLAKDSGGPGKHRGGLATEVTFECYAPSTRVTARTRDRTYFTGWGLKGGRPGSDSSFWLNPNSNRAENHKNTDIIKIGPGDVVSIASGGAGGWGDPLDRDPAKVALDVVRRFVSNERARDDYGVGLAGPGADVGATERMRVELRSRSTINGALFVHGTYRHAREAIWTKANYRTLTQLLFQQPVHWRFYLKHRVFDAIAALRVEERKGDGSEVARVSARHIDEFPQLREKAAE